MKKLNLAVILLLISVIVVSCTDVSDSNTESSSIKSAVLPSETEAIDSSQPESISSDLSESISQPTSISSSQEPESEEIASDIGYSITDNTLTYLDIDYKIIEVDGGDRNGNRLPNVAVDVGFGDREYWALTNEHGQLVYVLADNIILQDDATEPVNSDGRYYDDEADVLGTEHEELDQGHVIADSLGGVANAYNITPQDSVLNRHGDQAYMEKVIRDAGGCSDFVATITYPNTKTQIPSSYKFEYVLMCNEITDKFDNINPDEQNAQTSSVSTEPQEEVIEDISDIDTNGNGAVTISEAKAAGFAMPITSDHWLYKYMKDADGDGMVGE